MKIGELKKQAQKAAKKKGASVAARASTARASIIGMRRGSGRDPDEKEQDETHKKDATEAARMVEMGSYERQKGSRPQKSGGVRSKKHAAKLKKRDKVKVDGIIGHDEDERRMEAAAAAREKLRRGVSGLIKLQSQNELKVKSGEERVK